MLKWHFMFEFPIHDFKIAFSHYYTAHINLSENTMCSFLRQRVKFERSKYLS